MQSASLGPKSLEAVSKVFDKLLPCAMTAPAQGGAAMSRLAIAWSCACDAKGQVTQGRKADSANQNIPG